MAEQFLTNQQVAQIAFESAGAATRPLMQDHPDYVFPSERVSAAVDEVLLEHGIDVAPLEGYGSVRDARKRAEQPVEDTREFGEPAILSMDPSATVGEAAEKQAELDRAAASDALENMIRHAGGLEVEALSLAEGPQIMLLLVTGGDSRYSLHTTGESGERRLHVARVVDPDEMSA